MTEDQIFAEWVILELMGHRRLAGFLTEQEIAGKGFLRLEIPGRQGATQLYNPASVYCITPTTEAIARAVAADARPEPVRRWELPVSVGGDAEEYDPEPASFPSDGGPF